MGVPTGWTQEEYDRYLDTPQSRNVYGSTWTFTPREMLAYDPSPGYTERYLSYMTPQEASDPATTFNKYMASYAASGMDLNRMDSNGVSVLGNAIASAASIGIYPGVQDVDRWGLREVFPQLSEWPGLRTRIAETIQRAPQGTAQNMTQMAETGAVPEGSYTPPAPHNEGWGGGLLGSIADAVENVGDVLGAALDDPFGTAQALTGNPLGIPGADVNMVEHPTDYSEWSPVTQAAAATGGALLAGGAVADMTGSSLAGSAAGGATKSAIAGGDPVEGAIGGAISPAVSGSVSDAVGGGALGDIAGGAAVGATKAELGGGDVTSGALGGALSPAVGAAVNALGSLGTGDDVAASLGMPTDAELEDGFSPLDEGNEAADLQAFTDTPVLGAGEETSIGGAVVPDDVADDQLDLEAFDPGLADELNDSGGALTLPEDTSATADLQDDLNLDDLEEPSQVPTDGAEGDTMDDELNFDDLFGSEDADLGLSDTELSDILAGGDGSGGALTGDDNLDDLLGGADSGGDDPFADLSEGELADILAGGDGSGDVLTGGGTGTGSGLGSVASAIINKLKSLGSGAVDTVRKALQGDQNAIKTITGLGIPAALLGSIFFEKNESPLLGPVKQATEGALSNAAAYAATPTIGLTPSQQRAIQLANANTGNYEADLAKSGALADTAAAGITPEQIARYQNPYLEGVLSPQLRDIEEAADRRRQQMKAIASMSGQDLQPTGTTPGTFSVNDSLLDRETLRAISDATGKAYADSFNNATSLAGKDLDRSLQSSQIYGNLGKEESALGTVDLANLNTAGALERLPQEDERTKLSTASQLYSKAAAGAAGAIPVTTPKSKLTQVAGALGAMKTAKDIGLY